MFKTGSKRVIKKIAEAASDLVSNKIRDKIAKVSKTSSQNNSTTATNEEENIGLDREIPREVYMYVCMCVCMYIYTHTHTHTHTLIYLSIYLQKKDRKLLII